jgi:hypothetical protein
MLACGFSAFTKCCHFRQNRMYRLRMYGVIGNVTEFIKILVTAYEPLIFFLLILTLPSTGESA